jgi:autotransporter-associated beta strand protein
LTNNITGTSSGTLVKSGAGTLTASSAVAGNNFFNGAVIVNEGTLANADSGKGLLYASSFTVNNGGILTVASSGVGFGQMSNLTVNAGGIFRGGYQNLGNVALNGGTIDGTVSFAGNNFALGQNVTVGGSSVSTIQGNAGLALSMNIGSTNVTRIFDVADATGDAGADLIVSSVLRDAHTSGTAASLQKSGLGTMRLTGSNSYTGATIVAAGTLQLDRTGGSALGTTTGVTISNAATLLISQSDQVNSVAAVTLSGGTIQRASGVSEIFGNLNLTSDSTLDYGTGTAGALSFGTYTESALLTVANFLPGNKLQFATGFNSALLPTGGSLSNENFSFSNGFTTGTEGSYFTITAIPEPSAYAAAAGLLGLLAWGPLRRRLSSAR